MRYVTLLLITAAISLVSSSPAFAKDASLWSRDNATAWCIVPYDAKHRGPVERAEMLERLSLTKLAYDYRDEHIPTFDAEVQAMKAHGLEIVAWWFPVTLDDTAKRIFEVIARHGIHPQLWVTGWETDAIKGLSNDQRIVREAERLAPICRQAQRLDCKVALYNHGGWFGEPDNQIAVIERLRAGGVTNVGMVYNFHHAHAHIADFPKLWPRMQPYVYAVNLNGMVRDGEARGQKIVPLGNGTEELTMMRVINRSGWHGLIGLLNHQTDVDAELALTRNLAGLEMLSGILAGEATRDSRQP